jgi:hypothetical protein
VSYDISGRSQEWIDGFLEGQRCTLRELEPLTLKTKDSRFVKVECYVATRAEWTEPTGAVCSMVGAADGSEMGVIRIVEEP